MVATVKTLGAVTRAVVGTASLLGKGVNAVAKIARNGKSDSPVIEGGGNRNRKNELGLSASLLAGRTARFPQLLPGPGQSKWKQET